MRKCESWEEFLSDGESGEMTKLHVILNILIFISKEANKKIYIYNLIFLGLIGYIEFILKLYLQN